VLLHGILKISDRKVREEPFSGVKKNGARWKKSQPAVPPVSLADLDAPAKTPKSPGAQEIWGVFFP